jgi:hypothetical protein
MKEMTPDNIAQHVTYWEQQVEASRRALDYAEKQLHNYQNLGRVATGECQLALIIGDAENVVD